MNGYHGLKRCHEVALTKNADRFIGTNPGGVDLADQLVLDDAYIIHAYTVDKKSANAIARELNCNLQPITFRLKRAGIEIRPAKRSLPVDYIKSAYMSGKSTVVIAKELGCSIHVVWDRLREHGISIRSQSEANGGKQRGECNPFYGKHHDLETCKVMSEKKLGKPLDAEHKHKMSIAQKKRLEREPNPILAPQYGKENPNWRGGSSFGKYCPKFNRRLKEQIRDKFGRKCFLCSKTETENGKKLEIHHVDYNKNSICNGNTWPLIPLCIHHHRQTNGKRHYWFNRLINYWAVNPEINFNFL